MVFVALHLLLSRTRWGILVRAATEDREMTGALGVNQRWLFTGVFALGAALAGLGGALAIPREPANLEIDLAVVSDAFVVVVVGGLGSIPGAFLAALLIAEIKAFCIGLGYSKLTLVAEFIVMAVVLVLGPGACSAGGRQRRAATPDAALDFASARILLAAAWSRLRWFPCSPADTRWCSSPTCWCSLCSRSACISCSDAGGMVSFGHAAYFGLGAYGAALLVLRAGLPMELALLLGPLAAAAGAALFGWFCVRLSGIYLAMLTLAFAQIVWSIAFQWDAVTGGSNGLVGIWPASWLGSRGAYYLATLAAVRARNRGALAHRRLAVRPRLARSARFAAARGSDRNRRARAAMDRVHRRRHRSPGWPEACTRFPRAPSRPRRCRYLVRSTGW